jgi:hypothetical protein
MHGEIHVHVLPYFYFQKNILVRFIFKKMVLCFLPYCTIAN